jgi:hypothetical protein
MPKSNIVIDPDGRQVGLYTDDKTGKLISTHSMLKTFRRCPKQAEFKYVHRLKPRRLGGPLKRGTWVHLLLEEFHMGRDWMAVHRKLSAEFNNLFDEEKDFYGDMPTEILAIMQSYIWHYKHDPWKVLETEFVLETELPDGSIFRCRVDALIENEFGLWLVDHKTHKTLPDHNFRLLDAQSALYVWCALRNRIKVQGFIWNYIRWKAPSKPKMTLQGRLSKSPCDTDYPTYVRELRRLKAEEGLRITAEYKAKAEALLRQRYRHGEPQTSSFFRRDILEKNPAMLRRVALEAFTTHKRMHSYDFSDADRVERVVERGCTFSCSYTDICTAELMGGNIRTLVKQNYKVGDPMDYYFDDKAPEKGDA